MNKRIYLIILLLTCRICNAQNLVPNGDFEQYSGCPNYIGQLDSTLNWINPSYVLPSPCYFNACATPIFAGIPKNYFGFQPAYSGNAYAGIFLCLDCVLDNVSSARTYIEAPLTSPLVSNMCYHFEMYVSLANNSRYTTNSIGVYFSDTLVTGIATDTFPLPFIPQINNIAIIVYDTLNWMHISANYTATGTENYLIIGNFDVDSLLFVDSLTPGAVYLTMAFYYIDDVSLSPCTVIEEQNQTYRINISPNPVSDKLNVAVNNSGLSEIILYEIISRKILKQSFTNSISLNTSELKKGIYLYEVRNKDGLCKKGKVVKD